MESSIDLNQPRTEYSSVSASLLAHLHEDSPCVARINGDQQLLFPIAPQVLCADLGLAWTTANKLFEDGWLSFSPELVGHLNDAQEAELRFLGSLVSAGCNDDMLSVLLSGLEKPYAYDVKRIYFDWTFRRWRLLPDPAAYPEAAFTDWLETLVHQQDVSSLTGIGELARDAIARLEAHSLEEPSPESWRDTSDVEQSRG